MLSNQRRPRRCHPVGLQEPTRITMTTAIVRNYFSGNPNLVVKQHLFAVTVGLDAHVVLVGARMRHKGLHNEVRQWSFYTFHFNIRAQPRRDPSLNLFPRGIQQQQSAFATSLDQLVRLHHQLAGCHPRVPNHIQHAKRHDKRARAVEETSRDPTYAASRRAQLAFSTETVKGFFPWMPASGAKSGTTDTFSQASGSHCDSNRLPSTSRIARSAMTKLAHKN